jgi:alanyl-tRNA synthetase
MYATKIAEDGKLIWAEAEDPIIKDDEVLLEVHAAALNRADLLQRAGQYPPPPGWPDRFGLEAAGVIKAVGKDVEKEGHWHVGDEVCARIDGARRDSIARNHSVAHLLQAALREVLGTHVEQAGSLVDADKCRFDFTHFAALTAEEIAKVEAIVNNQIFSGLPITMTEMPLDEAKKLGAMALFGEKYGKTVRVVRMGNYSTELCGGTHIDNTARIGLFKIVSESSVAAGVRRIEACTGLGVLALLASKDKLLSDTAAELKAQNVIDVAKRAAQLQDELKNAHRELESLNAKLASSKRDDLMKNAVAVGSVKLAVARFDAMPLDIARSLADEIKADCPDTVAVIAAVNGADIKLLAIAGKDAVAAGAHAGKLVGAVAAITGGKGGGRPDNAMAGGREADKIGEALSAAAELLAAQLK